MMKYLWVNSHDICNCMWLGEYVYTYRGGGYRKAGRREEQANVAKGQQFLTLVVGTQVHYIIFPTFVYDSCS